MKEIEKKKKHTATKLSHTHRNKINKENKTIYFPSSKNKIFIQPLISTYILFFVPRILNIL